MKAGTSWARHGLVLVLALADALKPMLDLYIGSWADKEQIHSALFLASAHADLIWRNVPYA